MDACRTTFKFSCGLIVFCASIKFQQLVVGTYSVDVEYIYVLIKGTGRCVSGAGEAMRWVCCGKGNIRLIGVTFFCS